MLADDSIEWSPFAQSITAIKWKLGESSKIYLSDLNQKPFDSEDLLILRVQLQISENAATEAYNLLQLSRWTRVSTRESLKVHFEMPWNAIRFPTLRVK